MSASAVISVSSKKPLNKLKQNGLHRRLSVTVAGASSGVRLLGSRASSLFKTAEEKQQSHSLVLAQESRRFVETLGELKGAYVKIGQMMALYGHHILPTEVTDALHELEHQTTPLDWKTIEHEINTVLGDKAALLTIDPNPLAAASLAQVHRATDEQNDAQLCLKVQYPGVVNTIDGDFNVVLQMLRMGRWLKSGQDIEAWVQEIKDMLVDEVDYQREAKMTERVATLLGSDQRYVVPKIATRYSADTVLAMSYESGYEVTNTKITNLSQQRRNALAESMLEVFFKEVFEWGIMQTDPNFGNYRIRLRENTQAQDQLVLLDFGAVRELPQPFCRALRQIIIAAHLEDREQVISGAINLGCLDPDQPVAVKESFADFCILLMEPFRTDHAHTPKFAVTAKGEYDWHGSRLLRRVGKVGAQAVLADGFTSPPKEFALIARKLTGVFTFITTLKAEFNAHNIIAAYLDKV